MHDSSSRLKRDDRSRRQCRRYCRSFETPIAEYFSPELLKLTAPQHAACMALIVCFMLLPFAIARGPFYFTLRVVLAGTGLVTSPPLVGVFMPFYYLAYGLFQLRTEDHPAARLVDLRSKSPVS